MPGAALNNVTTTTFNEADPYAVATDFFASIDWGDGSTSAGAVANAPGGGFEATGSHVYTEAGSFTVTTTITDAQAGTTLTRTTTALIGPAAPLPFSWLAYEGMQLWGRILLPEPAAVISPIDHVAEIPSDVRVTFAAAHDDPWCKLAEVEDLYTKSNPTPGSLCSTGRGTAPVRAPIRNAMTRPFWNCCRADATAPTAT